MKSHDFTILFFCLFLLTYFSCTQSPEKKPKKKEVTAMNTVTLATFANWTGAWEKQGQEYTDSILTLFFTMPVIDLEEVLGENIDSARYYLGLDTSIVPHFPHLLLVGVDSTGGSMINPTAGYNIYDVTMPCPPYCGKKKK